MDPEDARCGCGRREGPALNFRGRAVKLRCLHNGSYATDDPDFHAVAWPDGSLTVFRMLSIEHAVDEVHYAAPM